MKQFIGFAAVAVLFLTASHPGVAAEFDELSETDYLSDAPLISSATRLKQERRDTPASITVIDRKMIEASSAINIIELFRLVPGFQVGSLDGTESTTTYHGLSDQHNNRLQILIDGRSVYDPTFGGGLWYALPLTMDEIKRIEVIRGPNAASYGSNSFSAVINIITFAADENQGSNISYTNGSHDLHRVRLSHADSFNKQTGFRLVFEDESHDGTKNLVDDDDNQPIFDDHMHKQVNLRIDHTSSNGLKHTFQSGLKRLKFGDGILTHTDPPPRYIKAVSAYQNYVLEQNTGLLNSQKLQIYHNYVDLNDKTLAFVDAFPGVPLSFDTSFRDHRYDIEYQKNRIYSPKLQSVVGLGARYDVTETPSWLNTDRLERYSLRAFGHIEFRQTNNLIWNAGAMYEYFENVGDYLSPRLALNWHPSPQHSFRTSLSQAYRMPSFYAESAFLTVDLAAPFLTFNAGDPIWLLNRGDSNIEPERMRAFEIGYLGYFLDHTFEIDVKLGKEWLDNIITRPKTGLDAPPSIANPRFQFDNYGEVEIETLEIQTSYRPRNGTLLHAALSYTDAKGYTYDIHLGRNEKLDNTVPLVTSALLVSHQFPRNFTASAQYAYVRDYESGGDGDDLKALESVDVKLSKKFRLEQNEIKLSFVVRNIRDNPYQDFTNENLVGMESFFTIELGLK
ncbi:MAG: TonB-dependent receptor [Chromatiales bacterium]|jgi:iron complex outermembrane receptor protein